LGTWSAADRDLHGMDTARRPVSETEDKRRLGRRACCAQDREKGRAVVLTMACVKVRSTGSMADAPGRRGCGGPGRRGRGPKAPQRGTRPPARSGVSSSFSVSSSRRPTLGITAGAVTPNTAQSWRLDSLRVVAPGPILSPGASLFSSSLPQHRRRRIGVFPWAAAVWRKRVRPIFIGAG
jgi:hypothetical protein